MFKDQWLPKLFRYDNATGYLYWNEFDDEILEMLSFSKETYELYSRGKKNFIDPITTKGNHGYFFVNIPYYVDGKKYKKVLTVHRVIWFICKGIWPNVIDHINGNRLDNRLCNLRSVDTTTNTYNTKLRHTNKAGKTGVAWSKCKKKWRAYGFIKGKQIFLGYFVKVEEAISARLQWEQDNEILCRG